MPDRLRRTVASGDYARLLQARGKTQPLAACGASHVTSPRTLKNHHRKLLRSRTSPAGARRGLRSKARSDAVCHLFCLLSGCRAGEAARLRWIDVHDNEQSFTIPNAKAGHDINLPFFRRDCGALLGWPSDAAKPGADLVFPGLGYIDYRDAGLPVKGHALRHTYSTDVADLEGGRIDPPLSFRPRAKWDQSEVHYKSRRTLNGPAMRAAQKARSVRGMFELLGL